MTHLAVSAFGRIDILVAAAGIEQDPSSSERPPLLDLPTTSWQPGAVIRDTYRFEIMDHTPSGDYQIGVVMYGLLDGVRLLIIDADGNPLGDTSILTPITVR